MRAIPTISRKLVSVSGMAIATAMLSHAPIARAQSFQASFNVVGGTATVTDTVPGVTSIDVNSDNAVINWIPTDTATGGGPINFQASGTATFTGTAGSGQNFAVLNRIIPVDITRPVQFNGTVNSEINISGSTFPGGTIFFYSPGGIILGSTANFDVGSLALTTLDLSYDTGTGTFDSAGTYSFNPSTVSQATLPGSEVRILPGAQIDTTLGNSYVALIAPSVYNGGTITVDGSVALVAADTTTITFAPGGISNGLFDIVVTEGSSATGNVVTNVGTITGPASANVGTFQRVYMVAVARNDAITMAIGSGSSLGFDIAGAADVVGNAIVLSAGYDVIAGNPGFSPSFGSGTGQVSITGSNADFTSSFVARATGGVNLGSDSTAGLNFAADVNIIARGAASSLFASGAGVLNVVGDVSLIGDDISGIAPVVGRDVSINVDAGGTANLGGNVTLSSQGFGAATFTAGGTGGTGAGGLARIEASNGGQITIQGDVSLNASGLGGGVQASSGAGGLGLGGSAGIFATGTPGSSIQIIGDSTITATGTGGAGLFCSTCLPAGGNAVGGTATISALGAHSITIGGSTQIDVFGDGGSTQDGLAGNGTGGDVTIAAGNGASLTVHDLNVSAIGNGGIGLGLATAGSGLGGNIEISSFGLASSNATFNGDVVLSADGVGGAALNAGGFAATGTGGSVYAGASNGATFDITGNLIATATGAGGLGTFGNSAGTGGQVTLEAVLGGTVSVGLATLLEALGSGGFNEDPGARYISTGGLAEIVLDGGEAQLLGGVRINANGQGNEVGNSGPAGTGVGGIARITSIGASLFNSPGVVEITATGTGGSDSDSLFAVLGGDGTGGTASVSLQGGLATIGGNLIIDASGIGGHGNLFDTTTTGGFGTGGIAQLDAGSALTPGFGGALGVLGFTSIIADGTGGDGFAAGAGIGGAGNVYAQHGSLSMNSLFLAARGTGSGGQVGGSGGAATGGVINMLALNSLAGPSLITAADTVVTAAATGGGLTISNFNTTPGGAGGQAQGGSVVVAGSAGNGTLQLGSVNASADATGGLGGDGIGSEGGNGGSAAAGTVRVGLISGAPTGTINAGSATFASVNATAVATGGAGGAGDTGSATGVGGAGGNATGGTAALDVKGGLVTISGLGEWRTDAIGGNGGAGVTAGAGGNAVIGSANPAAPVGSMAQLKSRENEPSQRGNLVAADLVFTSTALGGTGVTAGTATKAGAATAFQIVDSTIAANNIFLNSDAAPGASLNIVDPVAMENSSASITGSFLSTTSTSTSLRLDQSSLTAGAVSISAANWVLDPSVPATLGTLTGTSAISLVSGQDLVAHANLATQGTVSLNALGRIDFGSITAAGFLEAVAGTTLAIDDVSAESIDLTANGVIDTGSLIATTFISAQSQGNITTGNLSAGIGVPTGANGELNSINLRSAGSVSAGSIFAASNLGVFAGGAIATGQATAFDMLLLGGAGVSTGGLTATNRILMANATMEALGQTASGFDANLVFAATSVAPLTGPVTIIGPVTATAFTASTQGAFTSGAITVQPSAGASGNLLINTESTLTAGNLVAANTLQLIANGAIATGSLQSATQGVKVASIGGGISTTGINAVADVLLSASQSIGISGPVLANNVILLSGSNVTTGPIFAGAVLPFGVPLGAINPASITNATGTVLIGSNTMATETFLRSASTNYSALLAANPLRIAGTVNIGATVAGQFVSYSQGNMTGAFLAAFNALTVESDGLVTVGQRWQAAAMQIASADISIIDNGTLTNAQGQPVLSGLRTSATGSISLVSTGSAPAVIGDGISATGYALSAAEFALISTGELGIGAVDAANNPIDMQIGNLAVTAGGAIGSSNLAGANGRLVFGTGNRQTQVPGGAIRITGNVTGTGFVGTNIVEFATGRFELDAATGSLSLTQTGTALGGTIEIAASNIHVASGSILDRLAADPFYTGHADDLNRPAAVQLPEGVLRALGLDLTPTGTFYIQNTGTTLDPAGFFADFDFTDVNPPANATPASIAVIVNGKWQTAAGIVGGFAARDLVVENATALEFYTAGSSVNACALSAALCVPEQEADPIPAVSGQILMVSTNTLGNTPTFEEVLTAESSGEEPTPEEAEAQEKAAAKAEKATSPIAPPPQIIDSKPLEPQPTIDTPVAGSGNPSLIGSVVNENSAEGAAQ